MHSALALFMLSFLLFHLHSTLISIFTFTFTQDKRANFEVFLDNIYALWAVIFCFCLKWIFQHFLHSILLCVQHSLVLVSNCFYCFLYKAKWTFTNYSVTMAADYHSCSMWNSTLLATELSLPYQKSSAVHFVWF